MLSNESDADRRYHQLQKKHAPLAPVQVRIDSRSDVCSHDHIDGWFDRNSSGTDQRYDNRCGSTRRLKHNSYEDTHNERRDGVGIVPEETTCRAAG